MNCKRKGTRNEYKSIRLLEAAGYICTRAAASLGVFDIVAISETDIQAVFDSICNRINRTISAFTVLSFSADSFLSSS